jgi:hypothetical protein
MRRKESMDSFKARLYSRLKSKKTGLPGLFFEDEVPWIKQVSTLFF